MAKLTFKKLLSNALSILDKGKDAVVQDIRTRVNRPLNLVRGVQERAFGKGVVDDVYSKGRQLVQAGSQALKNEIMTPRPPMTIAQQAKRDLVQRPLKITKDLAQGIGYGAAYLNKSAYKAIGGDKAVAKISNPEIETMLFGRPVGTLQEFTKKTGEYAKEKGSSPRQVLTTQGVAILASIIGENPLNFSKTPAKQLFKNLAKETSEEIIQKELKANIKELSDDAIEVVSKSIAKADTEKEVMDILTEATKPQKKITKADRLIAEGKIRVVSRDGKDVYQTKEGGEWVNARDEDSAVKKLQPKPAKEKAPLPQNLEERTILLEQNKALLEEDPAKYLTKYMNKRTGELPEVLGRGKSKFGRKGDDIVDELGYKDSETARQAVPEYLSKKKALLEEERAVKQEIKEFRKSIASSKPEKSVKLSKGEVKSLEETAQEVLNKVDEPFRKQIPSLEKIITPPTPVIKKVNIVDWYFRTPEKVMEKIGFGKEMKGLRTGYEGYIQELKPNIEKITNWSKRVSKEGNEKIFKYLDGQEVVLNAEEQKVAQEIEAWLKQWADRLGLPEDKRISKYITHIFEDELIAKEFDEDLAKIIAERVPGSVYDPFLEQRLGKKGYIQDTWRALDAYVKRGTRKVHMDPALDAIKKKAGSSLEMANVEKSIYEYVQRFINNINMRPSNTDTLIDNAVKTAIGYKFGQRPVTRILKSLRQMTFRGMLGLNPSSAIRNLSQGANTFAVLGPKYTTVGYAGLLNPKYLADIRASGILADNFIQDRTISATKKLVEKADKVLFAFFDTAEKINRGAAFLGARSKALAQGRTLEQATEYAKKIVRQTQFSYSSLDTPVKLSGDIAKTFTQFGTYSVKQAEFLGTLAKQKQFGALFRYALAGMTFVYTIGQAFGMEPDELIPFLGTLKRGELPFGQPPSLKFPTEIAKAGLDAPDKYGNKRSTQKKLEDIGSAGVGLIPAGIQGRKTIRGMKAVEEGGSFTKSGQLKFEVGEKKGSKLQALLFGPNVSKEAKEYFKKGETISEADKKIAPVYERIQQLKTDGRNDEAIALFDSLSSGEQQIYKDYKSKITAQETNQGKKDILPIYQEIRQLKAEGKAQEALDAYNNLSEKEQKYYQLLKKQDETKELRSTAISTSEKTEPERNMLELISAYAKAYSIDPGNAFKAMVTKEKLGDIEGNLVSLQRFYGKEFNKKGGSEEYVYKLLDEMGIPASERSNYNLEHIVPVKAGGDNSPENLKIVDRETHNSWTPIDIALSNAVKSKKINRKRAAKLARDFKSGVITKDELLEQLKK